MKSLFLKMFFITYNHIEIDGLIRPLIPKGFEVKKIQKLKNTINSWGNQPKEEKGRDGQKGKAEKRIPS